MNAVDWILLAALVAQGAGLWWTLCLVKRTRGRADEAFEEATRRPPEVREQIALVDEWRMLRDSLPEGSPRHVALTNRLKSLGVE